MPENRIGHLQRNKNTNAIHGRYHEQKHVHADVDFGKPKKPKECEDSSLGDPGHRADPEHPARQRKAAHMGASRHGGGTTGGIESDVYC